MLSALASNGLTVRRTLLWNSWDVALAIDKSDTLVLLKLQWVSACGRCTVQWPAVLEWPLLVSLWAWPLLQQSTLASIKLALTFPGFLLFWLWWWFWVWFLWLMFSWFFYSDKVFWFLMFLTLIAFTCRWRQHNNLQSTVLSVYL